MPWSHLLLYTAGAAVIIIAPGPDFIYVTTRGIAGGRTAGVVSALGISCGLLFHTTLAALGLSAILQTSGLLFQAIQYAGAAYLVYLGVKSLLDKKALLAAPAAGQPAGVPSGAVFRQGMFTNILNPKAILTFLAFIPQFIVTDGTATVLQIVIMGSVIAALAVIWFGGVGLFAGSIGQWIVGNSRIQTWIKRVSGAVLIGLGLRLAVTERH